MRGGTGSEESGDGPKAGTLWLVTSQYPDLKSETFLTPELPRLLDTFSSVTLVPLVRSATPCPLPANVEVDHGYADRRRRRLAIPFGVARALRRAAVWRSLVTLLAASPRSVADYRGALVEWIRGTYRAETMDGFLRSRGELPGLLYFYWLVPEVMGAVWHTRATATGPTTAIVCRGHGGDIYPERHPRPGLFAYREPILDSVDRVACISADGADYLREHYPRQSAVIEVSRLGVEAAGRSNPSPDGSLRVLSVAHFHPNKRVGLLASALDQLARSRSDLTIEWHHVGDGEPSDEIDRLLAQPPPNLSIKLHGGIAHDSVLELLETEPYSVIVNTSASEGIPVSIMEAFAAGIPAIAPDVGGIGELVDESCGTLLDRHFSTDDLVRALADYGPGPGSGSRRTGAKERWNTRFNAEKNFKEWAATLALMDGRPS